MFRLKCGPGQAWFRLHRERPAQVRIRMPRRESLSNADVIRDRKQPHLLILGEPGAGKSTLLRQLGPIASSLDSPSLPLYSHYMR